MNAFMHAGRLANDNQLQDALDALGIPARAIVAPTPWDVGPVAAYLFPSDPVTFLDAGVNLPDGITALRNGLAEFALEPADVQRVIVTHAHFDHFGGAIWLQEQSSCRVLMHPDDIAISDPSTWTDGNRELFGPLGFTTEEIGRYYSVDPPFVMRSLVFSPLRDEETFATGDIRLRVEHHPGHTPGHVWVVEESSGAIFVGDYLIADHPTNAGMEIDRSQPTGRAPLLEQYIAGLRELAERPAPMLFPGHGPPIANKAEVIERRLAKSERRTRNVLRALVEYPDVTALELGKRMYGARPLHSWEVMADITGRLDLLVAEGAAFSRLGEDGAWYFRANAQEGSSRD
jgi:glyoxylase-like metal-dependent hydrolase (beta-lactamase superfamily II)